MDDSFEDYQAPGDPIKNRMDRFFHGEILSIAAA